MKDAKFIIIILLFFFGAGIMAEIEHYDDSVNNTGIMYQENDNIVLNEYNTFHNYGINYNLNESYLQFNPVKKYTFADNSKNLAVPDLTGKEYLGNGNYRIRVANGLTFDYNIYSGNFIVNGTPTVNAMSSGDLFNIPIGIYSFSFYKVSGTSNLDRLFYNLQVNDNVFIDGIRNNDIIYNENVLTNNNIISIILRDSSYTTYDNYQFKLQIEKGTTATAYTVPYIPPLKIDFIGSNQVEYINPYKAQTIKIDDINTVDEIEFELINTINPAVFNWNITTNPDIPFVRFYNNQTKLLYDFTDIDEINKIGNNLVASQSNFINLVDSALGLVDTFYRGFQSLFNKKFVDTIADYLRNGMTLPFMPTNFPWFK